MAPSRCGKISALVDLDMALKIAAFLITLVLCLAAGIVVFAALIIALNGYSESDALYGIIAFAVLSLIAALAMGLFSAFGAKVLAARGQQKWMAVLIAVIIFSIIGALAEVAAAAISIGIAEAVRVNF